MDDEAGNNSTVVARARLAYIHVLFFNITGTGCLWIASFVMLFRSITRTHCVPASAFKSLHASKRRAPAPGSGVHGGPPCSRCENSRSRFKRLENGATKQPFHASTKAQPDGQAFKWAGTSRPGSIAGRSLGPLASCSRRMSPPKMFATGRAPSMGVQQRPGKGRSKRTDTCQERASEHRRSRKTLRGCRDCALGGRQVVATWFEPKMARHAHHLILEKVPPARAAWDAVPA